jgi:TonB family protein
LWRGELHDRSSVVDRVNTHAAPARATRPLPLDFSEVEDHSATPVAEVIVSYAGTMLDVQHVGPTARRSKRRIGALVGAGAATIVAGLALFAFEAAQDWDGHRQASIAAFESGRIAPDEPGLGIGGWALVLGLLGLVPLTVGLARTNERRATAYTVGERSDVTFHTVLDRATGDAVLPLVAAGRLGFTSAMTGEIAAGNTRHRLCDLVDDGRARAEGAYYTVPLPVDARCRLEYGALTFHVNAVAPGRVVAGRDDTDRAFWASTAVSLVTIGGLLALANLAMPSDDTLALDDTIAENRYVGYISQPDRPDEEPEPRAEIAATAVIEGSTSGERASGEPGMMGDPTSKAAHRRAQIQRRENVPVALARRFDPIEDAQKAGILGQIASNSGHFLAQGPAPFTVGTDDSDVWGNLEGTEVGGAFGELGASLNGSGRGGGGDGTGIGLGDMGLIGEQRHGVRGSKLAYDHGNGTRIGGRSRRVPSIRVAKATTVCGGAGCLDKDVIRRVVRSHINEVRHCYNQGLVRDPNLQGRVAVQFRIDARGSVQSSFVGDSSIEDASVERCITNAVERWRFPAAPGRMGSVIVTYPFVLAPG